MLQALQSVISLLLGAGILILGNGLVGIVLPVRMSLEHVPTEISGLVMSAYYAGLVLGCLWSRDLIVRVGHIRAFAAFAALVGATTLVFALWFDPIVWGLLRVVVGFCMAGLFATIESWLNLRSSKESRGQILSLYMVTSYLASTLGQLLVNVWSVKGQELFCLGVMLICLSLVPVVLTRVAGPDLSQTKPLSLLRLYAISPLGVAASLGAGLISGAFYGMGAVFGASEGMSVFAISIFMGVTLIGGLLMQWPIGWLSDRYDRRTVLLWVLIVIAIVCLIEFTLSRVAHPTRWLLDLHRPLRRRGGDGLSARRRPCLRLCRARPDGPGLHRHAARLGAGRHGRADPGIAIHDPRWRLGAVPLSRRGGRSAGGLRPLPHEPAHGAAGRGTGEIRARAAKAPWWPARSIRDPHRPAPR